MSRKHIIFGLSIIATFLVVLVLSRFLNAFRMKSLAQTNANVRAFLWAIRKCEGTAGADGYRTMFTGKLFTSYDKHPEIANTGGGYTSTAAGAYQFLYTTWKALAAKLMLTDFSPASQDAAAVELIKEKGALDDVIAGRLEAAVKKCAKTWASLPGSPYGQPTHSLASVQSYFTAAGGAIA